MVCIINPLENKKHIIVNDKIALTKYYNLHKEQIWVGYNSKNYDVPIYKSIMLNMSPHKVSELIVKENVPAYNINPKFSTIQFYNFDIQTTMHSLKQLEAFMGNDIRETEVDFNKKINLNNDEWNKTIFYCTHDVEQTIEVFIKRINEYDSQISLIETFDKTLSLKNISSTKAQITALVTGCKKPSMIRNDEFDYTILPCISFIHDKYYQIYDFFDKTIREKRDTSLSFNFDVCGVPHQFGFGGLHGASKKPIKVSCCEGEHIWHADVNSYYPSMMIEHDFLTRNSDDKNKFVDVYKKRLAYKKAGNKKAQLPLKIVLNSQYGICNDKNSQAYDPRRAHEITINGQLMLTMLLDRLEEHVELIQSNTDGIIIKTRNKDELEFMKNTICWWEKTTKMGMAIDCINYIYQKDVNNYLFEFENGEIEVKGSYVKETHDLDNDLPIINYCVREYIKDSNFDYVKYINEHDKLIDFQKIFRRTGDYVCCWHNNVKYYEKTFRIFASNNVNDSCLYKQKLNKNKEKFANCPDNCFILNSDIHDTDIPGKLNKRWYINLVTSRLNDFGFDIISNNSSGIIENTKDFF